MRPGLVPTLALHLCLALGALPTRAHAQNVTRPTAPEISTREVDREPTGADLQRVIVRSGYSAPRLLALGRAQLAAGDVGPAIASFERGLLLTPRDGALREELARARDRAGVDAPSDTPLERAAAYLSIREWSLGVLTAAVLTSLLLLAVAGLRRRRALYASGLGLALLFGAVSLGGYLHRARDLTRAIVTSSSSVRLSPFSSAAVVARLQEGQSVKFTSDRRDEFVRVMAVDGAEGWVESKALAPLAAHPRAR